MNPLKSKMRLGAFVPGPGHHISAWRHPQVDPNCGLNIQHYIDLAKTAERGKFDMMFLSDGVGIRTHYKDNDELSRWGRIVQLEPLTLLSAVATHTNKIGLVGTASTSYSEPFHIARLFASLDFISQGRAAWNIVTSVTDAEAQNFNRDKQLSHPERYDRAREFVEVVKGLWNSWDDDAFVFNKTSGRFFEPEKLHILHHQGPHFKVRGPLNLARPPQGFPVLVQAGSSEDGMNLGANHANVIFTAHETFDTARAFYQTMKAKTQSSGRSPSQIKIMPGAFVVVGHTQAEAEDKYDQLQQLVDPVVGMGLLTGLLGDVDLSHLDPNSPLPPLPSTEGSKSRQQMLYERAQRDGLSIKDLYLSLTGSRGHRFIIGNPTQVADQLEDWFVSGACDGYNIMPPTLPGGLTDFVDLVIPELQRRDLFRKDYEGHSLRGNLGLERPGHHSIQPTNSLSGYPDVEI